MPIHQSRERARDRACSAHRKMHTMGALQVMDQGVDAGGVKGVSPHQQGLDRECLAQLGIGEMPADHLPDRLVVAEPQQFGNQP